MVTLFPFAKGRIDMTTTFGGIPIVTPADDMPGPGQGHWTYEAYAAIPDDGRCYEIVDGVLFMTPSPSGWHQKAAGRIFHYLLTHIEDAGLGQVFIVPLDVELTPKDVVQPDVFVLLNASGEKFIGSRIVGAPDLVVEVASPGTEDYDRYEKRDAYAHAGVPEYWVVDTMARTVGVLVLEGGKYRSLGVFEGQATLPSKVVPEFPIRVEQFFV